MKLSNVFKMEMFKNMHDRVNLLIMLGFMVINIIGGMMITHQANVWFRVPSTLEIMMAVLFAFSVFGRVIFLFVYPYQMARTDYKNKVMSLLIASGVSRVQYYFVKIGATLLFSLLSILLLVILPLLIVLISHDMSLALEFLEFTFEIDAGTFGVILFGWLSIFSMLMTAVILSRGRAYTIFVFVGLSIATSQLTFIFRPLFGLEWWQTSNTIVIMQHLITIAVMGLIGILVLRKQDL